MKKKDIQIGAVYAAKVSGRVVPVRIYATAMGGGWHGINQTTGREIRIKTAARLRRRWIA